MKSVKMKGKNVDEAVDSALKVLGLTTEQVDVKVINEGKSGMLGMFGGEEAEVEVMEKLSREDLVKTFLADILDKMGYVAMVKVLGNEGDRILLEVKGEDIARIIGKDGATLDALQTLVGTMASRTVKERVRVSIDAEGYRQRRKSAIERLAQETINDVERLGIEKMLPPMSPADRRTVHMLLQNHPKLGSFSVGERANRRVVITLAEKVPKDAKKK
ncbi:MAG: KH domain-containing protein [Candidatus Margulisbacteria bacterium]|nr:KH domain-containing protein [Candidatus Margulisiibacteriota bacterium]MBU1021986.1 KH domain-containing protein [Candidatus Margulisiibacteriota bacterium]MBU1728964.1 KH domain-containing protein [Candidatus Margulisiibacteriota bacterium]MBU1954770.1 KH domain-containing protein [Candidatus Margulisiibacteriota bacterium]